MVFSNELIPGKRRLDFVFPPVDNEAMRHLHDYDAVGLYSVAEGKLAGADLLCRIEEKMMPCHTHGQLSAFHSAKPLEQMLSTAMWRRRRSGEYRVVRETGGRALGIAAIPSFGNRFHQ